MHFAGSCDVKTTPTFSSEGQGSVLDMATAEKDVAGSDKDEPPVSSTDEKYPIIVHYCGGSW